MSTTTNEEDYLSGHHRTGLLIWAACAALTVVIITALLVGWAVRHAMSDGPRMTSTQKQAVLVLSNFPSLLRDAMGEVRQIFDSSPTGLLTARQETERGNWQRIFPSAADPGYLLFSGLDPAANHTLVKLIRISDGREMGRWDPDWSAIYDRISDKKSAPKGSPHTAIPMHPILLSTGDVIFNTNHALVRLNSCMRTAAWVLDMRMHHSNELDADGTIWTPSETSMAFPENPWLNERVRDDSLAHVSADGKLLENRSFIRILEKNGLGALVYGTTGWRPQTDPVHLNEIKAATHDGSYWKKGDLLISSRHLSAVFLYRPSTDTIVWHRVGPWLNQHSPAFLDDHRISIFDNNVYAGAPREHAFIKRDDANRVMIYDFATNEVTEPFQPLLAAARLLTVTHGRARVLPDGGLFVEESNNGRHLRFTKDRLLWSRVNDYDATRIGILTWSRYLTADEVAEPLKALARKPCAVPAGAAS